MIVFSSGLMGCAQNRTYAPQEDLSVSETIADYTLEEMVIELNEQMDCDMWEISPHGAVLRWAEQEEMGELSGFWNQWTGEVKLSKDLARYGAIRVQANLLHELGHALGYEHVEEPYHIMSTPVQSNFSEGRTYQVQITEFLEQIQADQPCLKDLGK